MVHLVGFTVEMSEELGSRIFVHMSVSPIWNIVIYVYGGCKRDRYAKANEDGGQKVFESNLRTFSCTLTLHVY